MMKVKKIFDFNDIIASWSKHVSQLSSDPQ